MKSKKQFFERGTLIFKNRLLLTLFVLALGIAVLGVANAATINFSTASQTPDLGNVSTQNQNVVQTAIQAPAPVTQDAVKQMILACWQMDQAMIDQWVKSTGLTKEDLLKMEQAWMQGVMQQNPNLDVQTAFSMQQTWMNNYLNNYRQVNQQNQAPQSSAPKQNNVQNNSNYKPYNNSSPQYNGWYCPPGWGYNNGYRCW